MKEAGNNVRIRIKYVRAYQKHFRVHVRRQLGRAPPGLGESWVTAGESMSSSRRAERTTANDLLAKPKQNRYNRIRLLGDDRKTQTEAFKSYRPGPDSAKFMLQTSLRTTIPAPVYRRAPGPRLSPRVFLALLEEV